MLSTLTMPLPMVVATLVEIKAPTRFSTAAIITALRIESARVEIQVAIALAESLKPFT